MLAPALRQVPATILVYLFVSAASADIIDFEVVPGETAADALAISTQYLATHGVSFINSDGSTPHLERRGGQDFNAGFKNSGLNGAPDIEALTHTGQFGTFFLRINTENISDGPVPDMLINYAAPVAAASGQIWDVDGTGFVTETEQWRITAYDDLGGTLATIDSPIGTSDGPESLDGRPWTWSFDLPSASIYQIRMAFIGGKLQDISMAFDNFKPAEATVVPLLVDVDIVPNNLHPDHDGTATAPSEINDVIRVVVFGTSTLVGDAVDLDTDLIDPATLAFGPGMGPIDASLTQNFNLDVDSDGLDDARFRFRMAGAAFDKIGCSETEGTLVGELTSGESFEGSDTFTSVCNAGCH